jgi:hypothetical protein
MATKKLPGVKRPAAGQLASLRSSLPSATPGTGAKPRGAGNALQVIIPTDTLRGLKMRAADEMTTVRVLVLRALKDAGYPVPADELKDRRGGV